EAHLGQVDDGLIQLIRQHGGQRLVVDHARLQQDLTEWTLIVLLPLQRDRELIGVDDPELDQDLADLLALAAAADDEPVIDRRRREPRDGRGLRGSGARLLRWLGTAEDAAHRSVHATCRSRRRVRSGAVLPSPNGVNRTRRALILDLREYRRNARAARIPARRLSPHRV